MKTRFVAAFLTFFPLIAQDREAPPPLGTPKPFAVPSGDTFTLKNGMKVTLAQYGAVPLVTVRADIAFGHANESSDQVWLSDLMAQLIAEGTTTRTAQQVANEAARMGGQLSVDIGADSSSATIEVLSEFTPDAVKLLADVLEHPLLPASELERVRGNLLRQLAASASQPGIRRHFVSGPSLRTPVPHRRSVEALCNRRCPQVLRG